MRSDRGRGELILSDGKTRSGSFFLRKKSRGFYEVRFYLDHPDLSVLPLDVVDFRDEEEKYKVRDIAEKHVKGEIIIFTCILENQS